MPRKPGQSRSPRLDPIGLQKLLGGMWADIAKAMNENGPVLSIAADDLLPAAPIAPDAVFDVKITLRGVRPAITRTVAVRNMTLGELHEVIQIAMGWDNAHLHDFEVPRTRQRFGTMSFDDSPWGMDSSDMWDDEEQVDLRLLVSVDQRRLIYTYDFGDSWMHDILISKPKTPKPGVTYPVCLKGQLACPPEDCGGIWGYVELVELLQLPPGELSNDDRERLEWTGPFDPEKFDAEAVTKRLRRAFPERKKKAPARKSVAKRSAKSKR